MPAWGTTSERWATPDADFIDVDWLAEAPAERAADQPLLVLFHGLEGSSDSHYARAYAQLARRLGFGEGFAYEHEHDIFGEHASECCAYRNPFNGGDRGKKPRNDFPGFGHGNGIGIVVVGAGQFVQGRRGVAHGGILVRRLRKSSILSGAGHAIG